MLLQNPHQLESGVAGGSDYGCFDGCLHQASISRICSASTCAERRSGDTMRMESSPAMVPTDCGQASASSAAATGCALPTLVFTTTRFCASRTLVTNSRTSREAEGNAGSAG